jgi:hypothetical protein
MPEHPQELGPVGLSVLAEHREADFVADAYR